MSEIANFAIFRRHADGHGSLLLPNSTEYTYVVSAVNLAVELMSTSHGRHCMANLCIQFDDTVKEQVWYPRFNGDLNIAQQRVDEFLEAIRTAFPIVCVDETISTPDILACHPRGEWVGDFNPRQQAVNLNASVCFPRAKISILSDYKKRVDDMVKAASSGHGPNFRIFQFLFAHAFLHEIGGHLLITYLGQGRIATPKSIQHPLYAGGEAGRALERMMLGGSLEFFRDNSQGDGQPGHPHLLKPNQMTQKISQFTIDEFTQYRFHFPYILSGNEAHMSTMQSMGHGNLTGNLQPGPHFISQSLHQGFHVYMADVRRVPAEPSIRVKAVV